LAQKMLTRQRKANVARPEKKVGFYQKPFVKEVPKGGRKNPEVKNKKKVNPTTPAEKTGRNVHTLIKATLVFEGGEPGNKKPKKAKRGSQKRGPPPPNLLWLQNCGKKKKNAWTPQKKNQNFKQTSVGGDCSPVGGACGGGLGLGLTKGQNQTQPPVEK